jgi:hypothetical protein
VVNVILCTVRPCYKSELPFVFEIISPNKRVYTLQVISYLISYIFHIVMLMAYPCNKRNRLIARMK